MEGVITKQKLEEFFKNKEDVIIKRLGLIQIILEKYEPEKVYQKLKTDIEEINKNIDQLTKIKNSLLIFHRIVYFKDINEITKFINNINGKQLKIYNNEETRTEIGKLITHQDLCTQVDEVKDIVLFKVIYEEAFGNDQRERFQKAYSKINNIKKLLEETNKIEDIYEENKKVFDKIKDIISNNNESKEDIIINQIIDYFKIQEKSDLINDLKIILKSKKYEMDLKSISFFFESFNPNDSNWNKKLPKGYETLSTKNLGELKEILKKLKEAQIYDYTEKSNYFRFFTALYEKKEAIDFLVSKINQDIKYLYDKIEPTNRTISIQKIEDCEGCIKVFKEFKEQTNNSNSKLFDAIKEKFKDNDEIINLFESFSKNYDSIIELDRKDNTSFKLFETVDKIIQNASFIFYQDKEDFRYGESKNDQTNMEELIHLKNRINIKPPKKDDENKPKDSFQINVKN